MSAWGSIVVRWLSGLTGVAILLALVIEPVAPHFRYADQLSSYGEAILGQEGPVDVVFIGTSRTRRAVMAQQLAPRLQEKLQRPVIVQDLGKTGGGADADYLLLRERLKQSPVSLVVMEYRAIPQSINHYHFIQAATWNDVLRNAWTLDGSLSRLAAMTRRKLEIFLTQISTRRWFSPPDRISAPATFDMSPPAPPNIVQLKRAAATGRQPEDRLPLGHPQNIVQDTYVRKTIELVKSHGGQIVLMSLPALDKQALTVAERERLERFFGVNVIALNDTELSGFSAHHYSDAHHQGWLALDVYTPLLTTWLAPRLESHKMSAEAP